VGRDIEREKDGRGEGREGDGVSSNNRQTTAKN